MLAGTGRYFWPLATQAPRGTWPMFVTAS